MLIDIPMPEPLALLDFQITVAAWRRIPRLRARLLAAAQTTVNYLPKKFRVPFTATILLTGNAKVRQLNHDFRGIDKLTNVLSFPQFDPDALPKHGKQKYRIELGGIALAYQYIAAEAKNDDKILINHIIHLVIHGILHLFGYDHMGDKEAAAMEKREIKIMKALGLPDPYAPFSLSTTSKQGKRSAP
jgi:probable rRNA maturation factor